MTAADQWDPPAVEALGRLDPALARLLAARPVASNGPGWRLHDVRWTPGQTCHFTYRVEADGRVPTFVSVQLTDEGWSTRDYLEDPALPGLLQATNPVHVAHRLARVCGHRVHGCVIEAVRYRPGSRCVLRYDVQTDAGPLTLYAKVFQPESFARIAPMAATLAGRPISVGLVPPLGEIWPDLKAVVGPAVDGRPVSAVLADAGVPIDQRMQLGYRLGEMLATFHGQSGVPAPPWSEEDQLDSLARAMAAVEVADPAFAARLRSILDTLRATVPCSGQDVLAHGSFRPGQVIVTASGRLTMLDTDGVCRADPGLDLGVALAHLRWQAARQPQAWQMLRRVERLLLAGYERVAGPVDRDALLWWRAAGLLKVAVRRYRRLEVATWSQTPMLADAAENLFTQQPPDRRSRAVVDLLDRTRMTSVLARALLPRGVTPLRLEIDAAEQLASAADRRTVVRYQVRGLTGTDPVAVIGKVFTEAHRARMLHEHLTVLANGPFRDGELRVPEPMGLVPRCRMVLYRNFDGDRLDRIHDGHRLEQGVESAARWLHRLHGCDVDLARQLSLQQEVVSAKQWATVIADAFPDLAVRAQSVAERWQGHVREGAGDAELVPIHKDFHAGHVLLGDDGVCVIDLDEARLGDPAMDIAHFCAYLEVTNGTEAARRLQETFLREYAAPGSEGIDLDPGFSAYTWLKIAKQWTLRSGPFHGSTPSERRVGVHRALKRAEAWLDA
jgi:aminoglycoside phosphotransferase (APT) family kinase protein